MLGKTYEAENCSAARCLEVVGERWSLLIIRDALFRGLTRFSEFERSLGIAPNVLTTRLAGFLDAGLMTMRNGGENSKSSQYGLTEKGRDLASVVVALTAWGDRWEAPNGAPVVYEHRICGGKVCQTMACDACGRSLTSDEMTARPVRRRGSRAQRPSNGP